MDRPSDDSSSPDSTTIKSSAITTKPDAKPQPTWSTTLFQTLSSFLPQHIVWQSDSTPSPPSLAPSPPPSAQPPSRSRSIETTSSPITGTHPLYDSLSFRSLSGTINVDINPQTADAKTPVPAELGLSSFSGAINVYMPASGVPERDYVTEIYSKSGAVNGSLILGRRTVVETLSEQINPNLQSVGGGTSLRTSCLSGQTNVTVTGTVGTLSSVHSTASRSMTLRYPREWSGTIEGSWTSGRMNLYGPGIQIVRQSPNEVVAKKGDGDSRLEFRTASGSVNVYFE